MRQIISVTTRTIPNSANFLIGSRNAVYFQQEGKPIPSFLKKLKTKNKQKNQKNPDELCQLLQLCDVNLILVFPLRF